MLPAAASLQKQGANKGATTAFLISTPESGVDSIAITYALLDPIMTLVRPVAAFVTAVAAGFLENLLNWREPKILVNHSKTQESGNCCPGEGQHEHTQHHSLIGKIRTGIQYGIVDIWGEIALWFYIGLGIAALITVLVPDALMVNLLGGGLSSMFIMLLVGVPLYICATASTPIAAALILKGVSPGAALVFLLVGPATNVTSLSVLFGLLGKKSTFRYLLVLSTGAVLFGLGVDQLYTFLDISPRAIIGEAADIIPEPVRIGSALLLVVFSIKPLYGQFRKLFQKKQSSVKFVSGFPDIQGHKRGHK
ncbi:hypothetical protein SAMN02745220_04938 [Desulfopila aestuarii DSM 18488]|uniref:Permease n=1 Tax=Desulfopila aestuarii DSM 18488 TaxID=1121416 RepID=A0A1M7YKI8_9BACT|nr:SO_0444 family Cu/Zn efflux transporter [Desulfopila aestuarii]SHO53133.1 hypothetical protein SAMN02745220_04938 [Desulfopila aestuarii DSM 18488]